MLYRTLCPFLMYWLAESKVMGCNVFHCNAKTPHKSISPAAHGYATDPAQKRANRTSFKNTYEGRSTKPNSLVAQFGTNPKWIEKAGWFADLGTFDRNYERVQL